MKIKLVALDIDGTILNSRGKLSSHTRNVVKKVRERGIYVVLATGRRLKRTIPLLQVLDLQLPLVVHNGAVIFRQSPKKTLLKQGIELKKAEKIIRCLEAERINYVVYTGESEGDRLFAPNYAWQEPENLMLTYMGEEPEKTARIKLQEAPVRISIIDDFEKVIPFYEYLHKDFSRWVKPMLFGTNSPWRGIEIICGQCSKGTGVAFVARHLGVQASEIMAIGDNVNDLEMITWAGLGVAMGNGAASLKQAADLIAKDNDEDGAALILSELLLEK